MNNPVEINMQHVTRQKTYKTADKLNLNTNTAPLINRQVSSQWIPDSKLVKE